MRIVLFIFLILHGAVHVFYAMHSKGVFKMAPEMEWPDGSILLEKTAPESIRRWAVILLITADMAFSAAAVGVLLQTGWWQLALIAAALFSSAVFFVFWDGKYEKLANQGAVGILINLGLIVLSASWKWIGFLSG